MKLVLRDKNGRRIPAIQFFVDRNSEASVKALPGKTIALIANIERNIFGRKVELRLKIIDIQ